MVKLIVIRGVELLDIPKNRLMEMEKQVQGKTEENSNT
jgi:hypothetical protein